MTLSSPKASPLQETPPDIPESIEFSGLKGRFFAWFLTSPMRRLLDFKMGKPDARVMELLELEAEHVVLDAGCGSGFHTLLVAEHVERGQVLAVDISQEMLDRLARTAAARGLESRIVPIRANGLSLPVKTGGVDRALSVAVWHHLADADGASAEGACAELVRALRPGGRVVVCDLHIEADKKAIAGLQGHDRAFNQAKLAQILEKSGLEQVHVERVGKWVLGAGVKGLKPGVES